MKVRESEVAKEGEGGGYFGTSGLFPATLKHCEIKGTKNGATQANYYFDKGNSFGNNLFGTQGQEVFGYKILEALAVVSGNDELSDPEATAVKFKAGSKDLMCIPELEDVKLKVWVKYEYSRYNGDISEKIAVKRFYSEDGVSGSELLAIASASTEAEKADAQSKKGAQLAKDTKYFEEVKYDDGITAEEVVAWKAAKSSKAAPTGNAAAAAGFPVAGAATTGFPVAN